MLTEIVGQLDRPESRVPTVWALGRQHVHYGVKEADDETVGAPARRGPDELREREVGIWLPDPTR